MFTGDHGRLVNGAARLGGSLRLLWITWILWIASFVVLYAYPLLFAGMVEGSFVGPASWLQTLPYPYHGGPWTWDLELWLPMVLAVVVPTGAHRVLARRVGSPFVAERARDAAKHDYRSPRSFVIETSPPLVRRLVRLYVMRLGIGMGLGMLPFDVLLSSRFRENFGCVSYAYVRSPAEHLGFTTMLLAVALFHAPFARRVLGRRPDSAVRGG